MFRSLFFCSSFLLLIACGGTGEKTDSQRQSRATLQNQSNGPAILKGIITNPRIAFIQVRTTGQGFKARVEKDGRFELPLTLKEPAYYDLLNGNRAIPIYIKPGSEMTVNFDGKNPGNTMVFTGDGSIENNYMQLKQRELGQIMRTNQQAYTLPEAEFMASMNQNLKKANDHLDQYIKSNPDIDEHFVALQRADAQYLWADEHFSYPKYHVFYGKDPSYKPSAAFNAFKEKTELNNDALIASPNYQKYLIHYLYQKANDMVKADPTLEAKQNALTLANLKTVKDEFTGQKVKDYLTFSVFQDHLKYQSVNDFRGIAGRISTRATPIQFTNKSSMQSTTNGDTLIEECLHQTLHTKTSMAKK